MTDVPSPSGLSETAQAWFTRMCDEFDFQDDPAGLELLTAAAWQLERMQQARAALAETGLCVKDRFDQVREHPAAAAERAASNLFRLLCRELGVGDGDDEKPRMERNVRNGKA